jgi:hypothetical protein
MAPALPFYGRKGNAGLHACATCYFSRKEDLRPPVVGGVLLLDEWLLSFDAVATCPAVRSPVDDAATTRRVLIIPVATCLTFDLTGVEGRGLRGVNHSMILLCSRE